MPKKDSVNVADDASAKSGKKKVQRGRVPTRSQDRPKHLISTMPHSCLQTMLPPRLQNCCVPSTCLPRVQQEQKQDQAFFSMEKIKGKRQIWILFMLMCRDRRLHRQPMQLMLHRLTLRLLNRRQKMKYSYRIPK
jgi:hypothetical protein